MQQSQINIPSTVNRVEVIDEKGRSYVNWKDGNKVIAELQDSNRTLKIFIKNTKDDSYE